MTTSGLRLHFLEVDPDALAERAGLLESSSRAVLESLALALVGDRARDELASTADDGG